MTSESAYVRVLETTDKQLLTIFQSVLESASIPFVVQGEDALNVFPVGTFGSGDRMHGLGASVHVPKEYVEEANTLLETISHPGGSVE